MRQGETKHRPVRKLPDTGRRVLDRQVKRFVEGPLQEPAFGAIPTPVIEGNLSVISGRGILEGQVQFGGFPARDGVGMKRLQDGWLVAREDPAHFQRTCAGFGLVLPTWNHDPAVAFTPCLTRQGLPASLPP